MKKNRIRNSSPRDKEPRNKKQIHEIGNLQPVNTNLTTTDDEEWKGVELNNENEALKKFNQQPEDKINQQPQDQLQNQNQQERKDAEEDLNSSDKKKITNKKEEIVNKKD